VCPRRLRSQRRSPVVPLLPSARKVVTLSSGSRRLTDPA
jgi:hypothetical protein